MMRAQHRRRRRGSALVEFALVAFAFYLLVAAVITFGQLFHSAQVAQDAARAGARELALIPLPADATFEDALADPQVRSRVYDPNYLVIDLENVPGGDLDAYFATLPMVNRSLRPAMIYDAADVDGVIRRLLRFPGALVKSTDPANPSGLSVAVPIVVNRAGGTEFIEWIAAVEEVRPDRLDPTTGPFSVTATGTDRGIVALRINIPYQSSAMSGYYADPGRPGMNLPTVADDSTVVELNAAPGQLASAQSTNSPVYSGPYGLGNFRLLGQKVRPYRRVLTAQALFRREVFAEQ